MVVSRREKIIGGVVLAVLGLLALDTYAISPYVVEHDRVVDAMDTAGRKLGKAQKLLKNRKQVAADWRIALESGLKTDPSAAENQALHAISDYAQANRISLESLKPDRAARVGDFQQIRIQATGAGSTAAIANLLYRVESAKIPLRVTDLRLNSRKDGTDDLSFALNVSTIVFSPAPETKRPAAKPAPKGDEQ